MIKEIIFLCLKENEIMKTIIILITLIIAATTISCEKDTTTICENLLEQGIADSISIKGDWAFKYLAKTLNGKKITNKEAISNENWIGFENNKIKGSICNALGGDYSISSINHISITIASITFKLCDNETNELESRLLKSLNNSKCYVISDNELIIHFSGNVDKNVLILTKK